MKQYHQEKQKIQAGKSKARMANLELLRCIAMMMVVVLHYLGKGDLLVDLTEESMGSIGMTAWLLESFCIVAVNVYMLISGYFLCVSSFKISRLIRLYIQVWIYSVGIGILAYVLGILPSEEFNIHYLLSLVFPVSMGHYWFMTAYVFLYLLLPFVCKAIDKMTKQQMQISLMALLLFFCVLKSILPVRLEEDGMGYDCLWYLCVFLSAAYLRKFPPAFLARKAKCLMLYVVSCLAIWGMLMGLRQVYLQTGSLERILKISLEYNHILPFLAAIGLMGFFLNMEVKGGIARFVNRIAPYTLGVYLLHENIGVRYAWQSWFGAGLVKDVGTLLFSTLLAVVVVFVAGIVVDWCYTLITTLLHLVLSKIKLYRIITGKIQKMDGAFIE